MIIDRFGESEALDPIQHILQIVAASIEMKLKARDFVNDFGGSFHNQIDAQALRNGPVVHHPEYLILLLAMIRGRGSSRIFWHCHDGNNFIRRYPSLFDGLALNVIDTDELVRECKAYP